MRIGLFGYGKMGKMLAQLASQRNHQVVAKVDVGTQDIDFDQMDCAIDFSTPTAAFDNIRNCIDHGVPIVSGTTGWLDRYDEITEYCNEKKGAFIYASNFSLGVNLFFELNEKLAKMMNGFDEYKVSMEEIHHVHKLDAPSGTAITLAKGVVHNSDYTGWTLHEGNKNEIPIRSKREGEVPGTHLVSYDSAIDSIEIKHTAHNRQGFALGAIIAAEWLVDKTGVFSMKDVLNL
ncbi:4-hydroxy-tetrahydrodipicolinate reductase [Allomuricauda sp. SCSIO 65647]|uniref:4-hydroxy-tetrahydrodipicolinate reductase n=1 Tax=Allomuricauda sp. SCSIO 65647 TaxID=2908843 RepID=UPI001F451C8C|nr:4-hydroxy-tetrahydrodipicolinate reductase [Muricauda sp. SCSIO 65647]UJH67887.1 4-hydroxy-tetrahydrodipicolinate reductase [Muricauda sp. SCSIO 65647]